MYTPRRMYDFNNFIFEIHSATCYCFLLLLITDYSKSAVF